ncbi:MAG: hypothetical protein A4E73_00374 [Syntrophaceae bacterium PtaU1.Bin231]|nr:MAG: hypothetical protein A4E73_00374 [Syntrophaceae bacterium PtaU1.Bin231]
MHDAVCPRRRPGAEVHGHRRGPGGIVQRARPEQAAVDRPREDRAVLEDEAVVPLAADQFVDVRRRGQDVGAVRHGDLAVGENREGEIGRHGREIEGVPVRAGIADGVGPPAVGEGVSVAACGARDRFVCPADDDVLDVGDAGGPGRRPRAQVDGDGRGIGRVVGRVAAASGRLHDRVRTAAGREDIRVVPQPARQNVIARTAGEDVRTCIAGERVGRRAADHVVDPADRGRRRGNRRRPGGEVDRDRRGVRGIVEGVRPAVASGDRPREGRAALENEAVVPLAADQRVRTGDVVHGVRAVGHGDGAGAADGEGQVGRRCREIEGVGAAGLGDRIRAPAVAEDVPVVAGPAGERVIAGPAGDDVRAAVAGERIVAGAADDVLDAAETARDACRSPGGQADRYGRRIGGVVQGVVAGGIGDRVGPAARRQNEPVVPGTALQDVVAGAAGEDIRVPVARERVGRRSAGDVVDVADTAGRADADARRRACAEVDRHRRGIRRIVEGVRAARPAVDRARKDCAVVEGEPVVPGAADNPLDLRRHLGLVAHDDADGQVVRTVRHGDGAVGVEGDGQVSRHRREVEDIRVGRGSIADRDRPPAVADADRVGRRAADHPVDMVDSARRTRRGPGSQVHRHAGRPGRVVEDVRQARTAVDDPREDGAVFEDEPVVQLSADDPFHAGDAAQGVGAVRHGYRPVGMDGEGQIIGHRGKIQGIVAGGIGDRVRPPSALEDIGVVARAAGERVVACTAGEDVGAAVAGNGVDLRAGDHVLDVAESVHHIRGRPGGEVHRHRGAVFRIVQRVAAAAGGLHDRVVCAVDIEQVYVVACAAGEDVGVRIADEDVAAGPADGVRDVADGPGDARRRAAEEIHGNAGRPGGVVEGVRSAGPPVDRAGEDRAVFEDEAVVSAAADDLLHAGDGAEAVRVVRHRDGAGGVDRESQIGRDGGEIQGVGAAGVDDGIGAPAAAEDVGVVPRTAGEDVAARAAGKNVGAAVACQRVVPGAADNVFDVGRVSGEVRRGAAERHRHSGRVGRVVQGVGASVGQFGDRVGSASRRQEVRIVACAAGQCVVACTALENVGAAIARQRVVPGTAGDILDVRDVAGDARRGAAERHRHRGRVGRVVQGVGAAVGQFGDGVRRAARRHDIGVVPRPAGEDVGVGIARQGIVSRAARDVAEIADAGSPRGRPGREVDRHGRRVGRVIEGVRPASAVDRPRENRILLELEAVIAASGDDPLYGGGPGQVAGAVRHGNLAVGMDGEVQRSRNGGKVEHVGPAGA